MGLTITNTNTMQLLNIVNRNSIDQSNTLKQLSTGLRINSGADDPAGLIAMESLQAEITSVNAALDNAQRADSMMNVADSALTEVSTLLTEIESLVAASSSEGGLSAAERAANQSQIDAAITAIDRIVNTTNFNGKQLLNGAQSIQTTGVDTSKTADLSIYSRGSSDLSVTTSETTTASAAGAEVALSSGDTLSADTEIVVVGTEGTATVQLASGDGVSEIVSKINAATGATGVTATANGTDDNFDLVTSGTGSDEYLSVEVLSGGTFNGSGSLEVARDEGADAVVNVNGTDVQADGKVVHYSANGYDFSFTFEGADTFTVKGSGGMTFQLGASSTTRQTIGISSMASYRLGGGDSGGVLSELKSGNSLDLNQNSSDSLKVVRKAISDVAASRGRIGGFQKFQVQTAIRSLEGTKVSLTDAKSTIADTDYAVATSELNRQSVLMNSGISLLGLANQQAAQLLSLLG